MKTKITMLAFALTLGMSAYAQQPAAVASNPKGILTSFPTKLKAQAPHGCTQWVTDGVNGLAILDKRLEYYKQQLHSYKSTLPPAPKDKRLSREEYDSAKANELKLKAIEHEMKCDAVNRHAFRKENLGWDKTKETEAARVQHESAVNVSLQDMEKTRREVLLKLQQIMEAQAKANRDVVNKL